MPRLLLKLSVTVALLVSLAACGTLPRSAALESEILAEPEAVVTADGDVVIPARGFDVAPVTRALLPVYARWPAVGEQYHTWIERVDQPNQRIIAPGDTVSITIWTSEENGLLVSGGQRSVQLPDMRVSPTGRVFLPYVGELNISGMAPQTARARIENAYSDVSPSAQVQLELVEGRANTVSLVGGVAAPGSYPLPDRDFTVMGLIAEGGGIAQTLRNPQIRLQRGGDIYGVSISRLLASPRLDTTLVGGDIIYVEEDDRTFQSLGATGNESLHYFPDAQVSALDAISIIGGVDESRANIQGILILRRYPQSAVRQDGSGPPDSRMIFTIDLASADGLFSADEFLIRPDDIVYITESPLTTTRTIFALIGSVFGLARQAQLN